MSARPGLYGGQPVMVVPTVIVSEGQPLVLVPSLDPSRFPA